MPKTVLEFNLLEMKSQRVMVENITNHNNMNHSNFKQWHQDKRQSRPYLGTYTIVLF